MAKLQGSRCTIVEVVGGMFGQGSDGDASEVSAAWDWEDGPAEIKGVLWADLAAADSEEEEGEELCRAAARASWVAPAAVVGSSGPMQGVSCSAQERGGWATRRRRRGPSPRRSAAHAVGT